ncbi:hypothetical protein Zmor_014979 [Zophobas morio]|uniref:Uncharacterized protein n=1 Tax=Zophobas morio TaxID=2755281 RepID=A0AA38IH12_9CUCU|nr:hypothetical protein Zmor_014979 [Zophobas morio]
MVLWNNNEKVKVATTDNGSNIVSAISLLGWTNLSCSGHTLNLVVDQDSLQKTPEIVATLKKCDHTAHIFKASCLATSILVDQQNLMNMKLKSIKENGLLLGGIPL